MSLVAVLVPIGAGLATSAAHATDAARATRAPAAALATQAPAPAAALAPVRPGGTPARPGGDGEPTTTTAPVQDAPDIIPRPNSGSPPSDAGDRGGALQLAVLALIVLAVAVLASLVVRESRRARRG